MEIDKEKLRKILLAFVERFGRTRLNLMAANTILQAIATMPPGQRAELTAAQIQAELKNCQRQLAEQSDPALRDIQKVLESEEPFEAALADFVLNLQW